MPKGRQLIRFFLRCVSSPRGRIIFNSRVKRQNYVEIESSSEQASNLYASMTAAANVAIHKTRDDQHWTGSVAGTIQGLVSIGIVGTISSRNSLRQCVINAPVSVTMAYQFDRRWKQLIVVLVWCCWHCSL